MFIYIPRVLLFINESLIQVVCLHMQVVQCFFSHLWLISVTYRVFRGMSSDFDARFLEDNFLSEDDWGKMCCNILAQNGVSKGITFVK